MKENNRMGLVIMASGLGKRFGGNKLVENLDNRPVIKWIIDITDNLFDKRVVVTRNKEVKALCDEINLECILHELPNRNDTVRLGLSSMMEDIDYCFFTPGDQPLIKKESIAKLIEKANDNPNKIVRTCYGDIVGSPVGFPKAFFDELLKLPEGKGGGWIAKNNSALLCTIEVQDEYELWDIDTVEDLKKVKSVLKNM